jgi:hypothetical protein
MNLHEILTQLKQERGRLDAAIQALDGVRGAAPAQRRGRPPGSSNKSVATTALLAGAPKARRTMSAAARKRIAEGMRKRWAAAKRSGKKRP